MKVRICHGDVKLSDCGSSLALFVHSIYLDLPGIDLVQLFDLASNLAVALLGLGSSFKWEMVLELLDSHRAMLSLIGDNFSQ